MTLHALKSLNFYISKEQDFQKKVSEAFANFQLLYLLRKAMPVLEHRARAPVPLATYKTPCELRECFQSSSGGIAVVFTLASSLVSPLTHPVSTHQNINSFNGLFTVSPLCKCW